MIINELEEFKIYITKRYLKLKNETLEIENGPNYNNQEYRAHLKTTGIILFKDAHKILNSYLKNKEEQNEIFEFDNKLKSLYEETKKIKNESTLAYLLAFIFLKIEYITNNFLTDEFKKCKINKKDLKELEKVLENSEKLLEQIEENITEDNIFLLRTYQEIIKYYAAVVEYNIRKEELTPEEYKKIHLLDEAILEKVNKYGEFGKKYVSAVKIMDNRYDAIKNNNEGNKKNKKLTLLEIVKKYNSNVIDYQNRNDTFDYDSGIGAFLGLLLLISVIGLAIIFG